MARPKRLAAEAVQDLTSGRRGKPGKKVRAVKADAASKKGVTSSARTGPGLDRPASRRSGVEPARAAGADTARAQVLDRLWAVILSRRDADVELSHSARLLSRGTAKVAQKFGEEAVECLIEALTGNRAALVAESADVLYHLLVMWVDAGLPPHAVWQELERREGVSGVA